MTALFLAFALALQTSPPPMEQGRELTSLFYEGKDAEVWSRFSDRAKQGFGGIATLTALRAKVAEQAGIETAIVDERVEVAGGASIYVRISRFTKTQGRVAVQWTFGSTGAVETFSIRAVPQEAPTDRLDYVTKTALRLPFTGSWFVGWGGRTLKDNYHAASVDQRFAYDLLMTRGGSTHAGDGKRNEDYYCFGQKLVAPGPGTVVSVENAIDDNAPGVMNPKAPLGNHVIIDHGNGEFSFLAHFQKGSVTVKPGDVVKTSDLLGLTGNSGNSSEPHLHYHLQDSAQFGKGRGMPAPFEDYVADGKPVKRGEPVKGQTIEAPSSRSSS